MSDSTTTMHDAPSPEPAREVWAAAYSAKLREAVTVLTDAARLARPRMERTDDGLWIESLIGETGQNDWAEFVTLALAGAAANLGGVEMILAGRSGSWEAEGVRQLLYSTVGSDEHGLWEHRTEPFDIILYVDELLAERTNASSEYDDATEELQRRYLAALEREPEFNESQYLWVYDRDDSGHWVPRDADAPAWSVEAWRASLREDGFDDDQIAPLEASLLEAAHGIYLPKSRAALTQLRQLEDAREERLGVDLEERLEEQRLQEWAAYGEALKAQVEAVAAAIPGLSVPVKVTVDVTTYREPAQRVEPSFVDSLIDAAVLNISSPADLPGTPLERLTQG